MPPIDPTADNHVLDKPHVFLDEIMRQAYDSEIIRFSMWIREGKPISQFPAANQQVMLLPRSQITEDVYQWADQILCATNETRFEVNKTMRRLKGFGPEPQVGDKVISLRNEWNFLGDDGETPLTNGTIGFVEEIYKDRIYVPHYISSEPIPIVYASMVDEDGHRFVDIPIDYTCLMTGKKFLTGRQEFLMRKNENCVDPPFEFAYADGITVHKAQGSEWGKVLGLEERFPFKRMEHRRWAYTCCTRASEKLVWGLKD